MVKNLICTIQITMLIGLVCGSLVVYYIILSRQTYRYITLSQKEIPIHLRSTYINISNHSIYWRSDEALIVSFHCAPKFLHGTGTDIFIENKQLYTSIHHYDSMLYLPTHLNQNSFKDPRTGSIRFKKVWMLDFLINWNPIQSRIHRSNYRSRLHTYSYGYCKHKYILWIDGDALFTKLDVPLNVLWNKLISLSIRNNNTDDIYMIVAQDASGINSGVLLIRCSEWSKLFIKYWLTWHLFQKPREHNDQGCLVEMYNFNYLNAQKHILKLNKNNSILLQGAAGYTDYGFYWKQNVSFVLHLPNHSRKELLRCVKKKCKKLQQYVTFNSSL
eukprot:469612_1